MTYLLLVCVTIQQVITETSREMTNPTPAPINAACPEIKTQNVLYYNVGDIVQDYFPELKSF